MRLVWEWVCHYENGSVIMRVGLSLWGLYENGSVIMRLVWEWVCHYENGFVIMRVGLSLWGLYENGSVIMRFVWEWVCHYNACMRMPKSTSFGCTNTVTSSQNTYNLLKAFTIFKFCSLIDLVHISSDQQAALLTTLPTTTICNATITFEQLSKSYTVLLDVYRPL